MLKDYNRYYVYAYLRADGSPYYIGKGTGYRVWHKNNNEVRPPSDKKLIVIIANRLTEVWAFALERRLIGWYGRKDLNTGILRNKSDGGEGSSGYRHTKEALIKISNAGKGRKHIVSQETKEKLRVAAIGKKKSIESVEKTKQGNLGKKRTPEQIKNIKENSGRRKGFTMTKEHKEKIMATKRARGLIKEKVC